MLAAFLAQLHDTMPLLLAPNRGDHRFKSGLDLVRPKTE